MAPNVCPACGKPQDAENRFCPQCGRRFDAAPVPAPAAAPGNGHDQPPGGADAADLLVQLRLAEQEFSRAAKRRAVGYASGCFTALVGFAVVVWIIGRGGCAAAP